MGHPASYYIKYLLLEHWDEEEEEEEYDHYAVLSTLRSYGLPDLGENEFTFLQLSLQPPQGFSFSNRKHKRTADFMKDEGLYTLWKPNQDNKQVLRSLLHQQRARNQIDIMLMGGIPVKHIVGHINKKFAWHSKLTKEMVDTYRFFFWNVDLPSVAEWEAMLYTSPQKDALMAAYHCGPDQAMFRIGGHPKIGDAKKPLREANRQAYWVLQALRFRPDTVANIKLLSRLAADLRALYSVLHGDGADLEEQLKMFRQFLVEKVPTKVAEFDKMLSEKGSYSGDGKEEEEDDASKSD